MLAKRCRFLSLIILLASLIAGNFFIAVGQINSGAPPSQKLADYLAFFYNRYSQHFDQNGLIFQAPDYEVKDFSAPKSAREILSLALYYRYRALAGETLAQNKIREALLSAEAELSARPFMTQSFSDAFVSLAEVQIFNQLPTLFSPLERDQIIQRIQERAEAGIKAADTSNRAALSAVYWQAVLNDFLEKKLINTQEYERLSALSYAKIKEFADTDITPDGWYLEGAPPKFNPHYHLVSAFAFLAYGELTGQLEFIKLAEKMTANLRLISFKNGLIEARLGDRPVGLGAQFYLGAGLLNRRFGFSDWSVYLNYARGNRFFSDPKFPNRLEYHSTLYKTAPRYHDDISFSNLAELALSLPVFSAVNINLNQTRLATGRQAAPAGGAYYITNDGTTLVFGDQSFRQTADGRYTTRQYLLPKNYTAERDLSDTDLDGLDNNEENLRGTDPQSIDTDNDGYSDWAEVQSGYNPLSAWNEKIVNPELVYGKSRLSSPELEQREAQILKLGLTKMLGSAKVSGSKTSWSALVNAYIYGRYTLSEIADTILNGPRAVHPSIPASVWRGTENYKKFLNSKK